MENLILSSTNLVGTDVKNREGENLGTVKEIAIDIESGRVAYLVLAFGGFLGIGDKYFAIPFEAFTLDLIDERLILNVEKERLKNAPGFDKDNMPDHPQSEFIDEVYSYYGYGNFLKNKLGETTSSTHYPNRPFDRSLNSEWENEDDFRNRSEDNNTRNRAFDPDGNQSFL